MSFLALARLGTSRPFPAIARHGSVGPLSLTSLGAQASAHRKERGRLILGGFDQRLAAMRLPDLGKVFQKAGGESLPGADRATIGLPDCPSWNR